MNICIIILKKFHKKPQKLKIFDTLSWDLIKKLYSNSQYCSFCKNIHNMVRYFAVSTNKI